MPNAALSFLQNQDTFLWKKKTRIILVFLLLSINVQSQNNDSIVTVSIKGKVKDSTYNFMLTSATVAVYKDVDSSLLQFSLPNNLGEFMIPKLPTDEQLRLIISHVGYTTFVKRFRLSSANTETDLGLLYMHQNTDKDGNTLEEVVVKAVPPMRMNGDTVEFNADAFRMQANATAEDLMRQLPGFTVWGDGEVTYNGKKINAILVEGKPFMGSSDPTVATQNLPKDALDKVQVYQQRDEKNPLDSTLFANIKLKEDKKMGYYGKLSGGYGVTPKSLTPGDKNYRYAADAMVSGFNKKLQLTTVGAFNNINKLANSTDQLMKNGSFKGEGNNIDYQSDFSMGGLNRPVAAGIKLQYDFIPDVQYQKSSRLNSDYFLSGNNASIINNSTTNSFLEADTILSLRSDKTNTSQMRNQRFNSTYGWNSERMNMVFTSSLNESYSNNINEDFSQQEKTGMGVISSSLSRNQTEFTNRNLQIGTEYTNRERPVYNSRNRIPSEFTVGYNFAAYDNNGYSRNQTDYTSKINATDSRNFDRVYKDRDASGTTHTVNVRYAGLTRLLLNRRSFGGVQMGLSGNFVFKSENFSDHVLDLDTLSGIYQSNLYLSNNRYAITRNLQPTFNVSKTFYKGLTNRYNKWVSLQANLRQQYFSMDHRATQSFQDFVYDYSYFVPDASVEYSNHQYGSYEVKYGLNFSTAVTYPGVNNIAPLVDSSNIWYIPKGNPHIRPQYKKDIAFSYTLTTRTTKNPLGFNLRIGIGKIADNITDSSIYDNAGIRTVYAVNADGNQYLSGEYGIRKSFEVKKNTTLEANGRYNINIGRSPQYINSIFNISKSTYQNLIFSLGFRHRDLLNLKAEQSWWIYESRQEGFNNNRFKSTNSYTRLVGTLLFPKWLSWSSNITYNQNGSNNAPSVFFTIWNAEVIYRFLKGDNGEAKFSALDLLRQNKGIINTATANTQTFTTSNVLQQYFMITLSYYPRKFGK